MKKIKKEKNDKVLHTHKNPIIAKVIQAYVGKYGIMEENVKFLHTQPVHVVKKSIDGNSQRTE